jgi:hypothetical protein
MYNYLGFGLHIASEIEFPELLPADFESPDITISIGNAPQRLGGDDVVHKVKVSISSKEYLQDVADVAHYYAAGGNTIYIQPQQGADAKSIRLFALNNAMVAVLHQRNNGLLQASGVYHDDGVALFCGHTGAGKSTIAAMLWQRGYKVFSDDVCVLKTAEGNSKTTMAIPSYPMMQLWADSFAKIGWELPDDGARLRPGLAKFGRLYHEGYEAAPMPVKRVFILNAFSQARQIGIKKLGPIEAFNALQQSAYRYGQITDVKGKSHHFTIMSKLAAGVQVYLINRAPGGNTLHEVVALIEANLHNER